MIPSTKLEPVTSSGNFKTGAASIDVTPEMFAMLSSKIYSDKVLAVVREIICNARDANVENAATEPLKIHLPTSLEPTFSVRDFGKGMTSDEVLSLYLRYGFSTKKASNEQIGGFGIGSKAPLAYADSFTVTSYKDGVMSCYSIYKDNGIPNVAEMFTVPSNEPNGLEVAVNVNTWDFSEFNRKTFIFLKTFGYPCEMASPSDQETLDSLIKSFEADLVVVGKNFYLTRDTTGASYYGEPVFVRMGGVVYKTSKTSSNGFFNEKLSMVLDFPIGSLQVAASRESLSEDEETIASINEAIKNANVEMEEIYKESLKTCKTFQHLYLKTKGLKRGQMEMIRNSIEYFSKSEGKAFNYYGYAKLLDGPSTKQYDTLKYDKRLRNPFVSRTSSIGGMLDSSESSGGIKVLVLDIDKYKKAFVRAFTKTLNQCPTTNPLYNIFVSTSPRLSRILVVDSVADICPKIEEVFGEDIKVHHASGLVGHLTYPYIPKKRVAGKRPVKGVTKFCKATGDLSIITELEEGTKGYLVYSYRKDLVQEDVINNSYIPVIYGTASEKEELVRTLKRFNKLDRDVYFANMSNKKVCKDSGLIPLTVDKFNTLVRKEVSKKEAMFSTINAKSLTGLTGVCLLDTVKGTKAEKSFNRAFPVTYAATVNRLAALLRLVAKDAYNLDKDKEFEVLTSKAKEEAEKLTSTFEKLFEDISFAFNDKEFKQDFLEIIDKRLKRVYKETRKAREAKKALHLEETGSYGIPF